MSELKEVKLYDMNLIKLGLRNDKLYFKSEADKALAAKDAEIARLNKIISDADKTSGEAVAELKEPYYTRCAICNKPWGAGELHALHRVTFHGRFVTSLFTCCDCNRKIQEGEI